jgi:hypothetical protein
VAHAKRGGFLQYELAKVANSPVEMITWTGLVEIFEADGKKSRSLTSFKRRMR